jgi:hypothetical protein
LDIATTLATTLEQGGVLVAVNLDPALGVNVAAQLNEWQLANAVLVLPRWPYRQALLPVDELVDALVGQADKLSRDTDMDNVVFVLDNQRTRSVAGRRKSDVRADNRYQLTVADLPGLTALRTRRIRRIVMLSAT